MVLLIAGGMSFYDALLHAFATAGTGGLSTRALSIGYYNSAYIDIVVGVFMILFGVNFSLYYLILLGNIRTALRNEELRWFLGVIAFSVITIAFDIRNLYGGVGHALRYSFFQVTSIISTTGFATADFNLWPEYSKFLLVLLMFVGGCAGQHRRRPEALARDAAVQILHDRGQEDAAPALRGKRPPRRQASRPGRPSTTP